jgi:multidrug efflux pump subunit AcrA (membrane-fusion protein)
VDVDNSNGLLKPGGYVEVHLKLPSPSTTFTIPVNATIFKAQGMQVAIVKDGKTVSLVPIAPGRDFGSEIEILSGLTAADSVVINPPDTITDGQQIRLAQTAGAPARGNR